MSLATATGLNLTMQSATAVSTPWPTTLGSVTIQVTDLKQNVPVDDAKFAKPAVTTAEEQKPAAK